ncbi:MAG: DNA polymerase II large subunit [Nanoarchaeota archaeon]|nr:DNA polymerase II large subunit [Nanoarchaeota archaeon]
MNTQDHFLDLKKEVDKVYSIMNLARAKGFDPVNQVEIPLAMSMAEKVVGLISTIYPQMQNSGISERILELEKEYGKLDPTVVFKIAEEISEQKFCKFSSILEGIDGGIRVGMAYSTLGVVSSPIEGYTGIEVGKTKDKKDYLIANFSGPIRSAGTTASCLALILIDFLREKFGFEKYDPTEKEVRRVWSEISDFHERITNLQYMPTEEETLFLAKNMPIQVSGDPSESLEVSNYKNLERVKTNFLRSGFCLVLAEGLAQKAAKGFRLLNQAKKNGISSTGFDFLKEYIEIHEKRTLGKDKSNSSPTYIKDLVAGRPVYGHPSRSGGFRFRYGRGRSSGFSATSVHPATMGVTDGFLAIGTQLKIEKPTKGCVVTTCDSIDGPIVKLKNGSVVSPKNQKEAENLYKEIEEILYLGDILFPFSDLLNRNASLIKPGYVEEWWDKELKEKGFKGEINCSLVSLEKAIEYSQNFSIPLHPKYIFFWTEISKEEFFELLSWLKNSWVDSNLVLPWTKKDKEIFPLGKRALELLGVPHEVTLENVIIKEIIAKSLLLNLGFDLKIFEKKTPLKNFEWNKFYLDKNVLEIVNSFSFFEIKDKAGEFIGARMGRPEKAKIRKLTGSPNVLFPVGSQGGRLRSVGVAYETGFVKGTFPLFYCEKCENETIYPSCEKCEGKTKKRYYFPDIKEKSFDQKIEYSSMEGVSSCSQKIDIKKYFDFAKNKLGLLRDEIPPLIKGLRGLSSESKIPENLAKGMLRSKYGLQVNKDGTIRMDATELPLVSFRPSEIGTSIEKLKEMGYDEDIYGKELKSEDQIVEIMPHDVLIPSSTETPDEKGEDVFMKICNFIDELLVKVYSLPPYYNVKEKSDIIGKLGVCMAPHNCAGVVCRFIGFSNTLGLMASPYMHAAIRRDCFDFNTYLPVREGAFWRNVKIGELVEKLNPDEVVDNFGTREKKIEGIKTISFEKNLKETEIINFTKHSPRKMFKIKTSLGKSLEVTQNHKFFIEGKEKRMSELKIGDKMPLPRKIKIKSRDLKEINLAEFLKEENLMVRNINFVLKNFSFEGVLSKLNISKKQFVNFKLRDSYPLELILNLDKKIQKKIFNFGKLAAKRDNVEVPIRIKLTEELLEVIGLYIAEGHSRKVNSKKGLNQVSISSNETRVRSFIEKVVKDSFGLVKTENKKDRVTFSSKILYLFFTKILEAGSLAKNKRLPYLFLNLPLNRLACILRGYFEGDGSVSSSDCRVSCDSISEGLLIDLEFCLARFGIFAKRYEYEKEPGKKLRDFYILKKRDLPKFKITKLVIGSSFIRDFKKIGFLSERKKSIFRGLFRKNPYGMRIDFDKNFVYDPIVSIDYVGEKESYCLNVSTKSHFVIGNSIVSKQCDGDEAAIMLLGDVLLNFSMKFLPRHRGGTQDAPLVLNAKIDAGEVDDQILDFEAVSEYPLELYTLAEQKVHSSKVNILTIRQILREGGDPFRKLGFTHNTKDINEGVLCSSYKLLGNMEEKVSHQMGLAEKLRSVDTSDTARLIIDRHFIRDLRGNLRKFSMQEFRCVACNEIMRRPPLEGKCILCGGKIIFTIHEGGIKKYLEPALSLAKKYNLSPYLQQNLGLVKGYIDSIFGKEKEKQEKLEQWF